MLPCCFGVPGASSRGRPLAGSPCWELSWPQAPNAALLGRLNSRLTRARASHARRALVCVEDGRACIRPVCVRCLLVFAALDGSELVIMAVAGETEGRPCFLAADREASWRRFFARSVWPTTPVPCPCWTCLSRASYWGHAVPPVQWPGRLCPIGSRAGQSQRCRWCMRYARAAEKAPAMLSFAGELGKRKSDDAR